jgi:hypothetical protein
MSNINTIIEKLILGMRDGKSADDILEKDPVYQDCYECEGTMSCWQDSCVGLTKEQAVDLAQHIVDLYDGKFPVDHLSAGDICIDAFHCNPCIITNRDTSIHVLYFNGKTKKFKLSQERYFKKLNRNVLLYLDKLLEIASNKAKSTSADNSLS